MTVGSLGSTSDTAAAGGIVEAHSIEFVPLAERHGRITDLFTLWLGTNIAPLPVITGALGAQVYGLNLWSSVTAILVGHALGAIVLALCSAQGPQLGVPQYIQSRGQFGRYGALLVVVFAAIIYVGFFTSNVILAGKSIQEVAPGITLSSGAIVAAVIAAAIGAVGYKFIHSMYRFGVWFMGAALLAGMWIAQSHLTADLAARGQLTLTGWLGMMSVAVIWQISFACYTSDYSRYLPPTVGITRPFVATFLGAWIGASLPFIFGAMVVAAAPTGTDIISAMRSETGVLGPVLMVLFIVNVICHNALNIYGATLSIITVIQTFLSRWVPSRGVRISLSACVVSLCLVAAIGAADDFIARFMRFILTLLIVMVPWATINVLDFYVVKRRRYDTRSLFASDGGIYGQFQLNAIIAYLIGIAAQLPFVTLPFYSGPVAIALGGTDISWLVSFLVTGAVYLALEGRRTRAAASVAGVA